ncbi:unnamed protein product [Arctogadus glacialis]
MLEKLCLSSSGPRIKMPSSEEEEGGEEEEEEEEEEACQRGSLSPGTRADIERRKERENERPTTAAAVREAVGEYERESLARPISTNLLVHGEQRPSPFFFPFLISRSVVLGLYLGTICKPVR